MKAKAIERIETFSGVDILPGKIVEILDVNFDDSTLYHIEWTNGNFTERAFYSKSGFITIGEEREIKLERLGI
jgi:hypothetical protein